MDNTRVYAPCPCGSGKKYKFCCLNKDRGTQEEGDSYFGRETVAAVFIDAGMRQAFDRVAPLLGDGVDLLMSLQFARAAKVFRKAARMEPQIYTAANNLAVALYQSGDVSGAIKAQQKGNKATPLPNPFGLASLAVFYRATKDETPGMKCLDEAMALVERLPSHDAATRVCEALARYRRHGDILAVADKSGFGSLQQVLFYTGVAAANLRQTARALTAFSGVASDTPWHGTARRYATLLRNRSDPPGVRGDWQYFTCGDVVAQNPGIGLLAKDVGCLRDCALVLDICEAAAGETDGMSVELVNAASISTHGESEGLLRLIMASPKVPDSARIAAAAGLGWRGALDAGQLRELELLVGGRKRRFFTLECEADENSGEMPSLPKKPMALLRKAFAMMVKAKEGDEDADDDSAWKAAADCFKQVVEAAPESVTARYGYAACLQEIGEVEEAEQVCRALLQAQPDHMICTTFLVMLLLREDRREEAGEIVNGFKMPARAHPDAITGWLIAKGGYHYFMEEDDEALWCVGNAYMINPYHQNVMALLDDLKTYQEII